MPQGSCRRPAAPNSISAWKLLCPQRWAGSTGKLTPGYFTTQTTDSLILFWEAESNSPQSEYELVIMISKWCSATSQARSFFFKVRWFSPGSCAAVSLCLENCKHKVRSLTTLKPTCWRETRWETTWRVRDAWEAPGCYTLSHFGFSQPRYQTCVWGSLQVTPASASVNCMTPQPQSASQYMSNHNKWWQLLYHLV